MKILVDFNPCFLLLSKNLVTNTKHSVELRGTVDFIIFSV